MKKEPKKAGKKPAKNKKSAEQPENDIFDFDNEIVIGVTKLPEPKKPQKEKTKKVKAKKQNNKTKKKQNKKSGQAVAQKTKKAKPNKKIDLKKEKRKRRILAFVKGITITTVVIGGALAFMLSPLFQIEKIEVEGNSKITANEAIILSEIQEGQNLFLTNNNSAINKIKQNPYIETVKIKKSLPDKITIEITERKATYALAYTGKYIYINNQGYILEIAENTNNLTQILSYRTSEEKINLGGRLGTEDLELLGTVLKIMEAANNNGIGNLITSIDIANKNDIILRIESERKNSILRKCIRNKYTNTIPKRNNRTRTRSRRRHYNKRRTKQRAWCNIQEKSIERKANK